MGTRQHQCVCLDCLDEVAGYESATFMITMEHMNKDELLEHIEKTTCPDCGTDNWQLTDHSVI